MSIKYLWAKLFKKIRGTAINNSSIHSTARIESGSHIVNSSFGKYSFCGYDCEIINTSIGAFCSIANNVVIGGANHPIDWVSTSPVFYFGRDSIKKKFSSYLRESDKYTSIGNDVWIGQFAIIKQGVKIGNGAVIGMASVVTKDVPSYTIVAGNPARLIRMRFPIGTIEGLEKSQWWNMDDAKIAKLSRYIQKPNEFIKSISKL